MNQRWTLHVENFARIESADIEIAPMMCFIGDNNSGKSYIMTLLWGIIANGQTILHHIFRNNFETESYIYCNDWLSKNIGQTAEITDEVEQMYIDWFNEILAQYKDELVRKIFNHDITIGRIEIRNFSRPEKLSCQLWNMSKKFQGYTPKKNARLVHIADVNDLLGIHFNLCWELLMEDLIIPTKALFGESTPVYLPSSRTGFLLARREISDRAIENTFSLPISGNNFQERFTAPYIKFLQMLNSLNEPKKIDDQQKSQLVKFLNDEILHGNVKVKEDGKIIRYSPEDTTTELPMSISSSVVTEIAPLLLLLTTRLPLQLIIIEEPEAHLHPALQKKIAQLLIRFVHSGIPVWITTHSDTILQHFNNMIKLNNRSKEEREELLREFGYTEEDLLTPEEINLYQFERGDKHTTIQKLKSGKYGFVAPSFNKAIEKLMSEIFAFQEDD